MKAWEVVLFWGRIGLLAGAMMVFRGVALGEAASDPNSFESLRNAHQKSLKTMGDENAKAIANWPKEFVAALTALQTQLQKKGDLDGWKEVKDALDLFDKEHRFRDKDVPVGNAELLTLENRYRDITSVLELDRSGRIVALTDKYLARLITLQTEFTKKNKMDEALMINAAIKAAKTNEAYTAAVFTVSAHAAQHERKPESAEKLELESSVKMAKGSPTTGSIPPPANEPAPAVASPRPAGPAASRDEEFKIYDKRPPVTGAVPYKNVILRTTPNMGVKRKLAGALMLGTVADSGGDSGSTTSYSSSKVKSGTTANNVRLNLRTTQADLALTNSIVVVEYYVRESTVSAGKITPDKALVKQMPVPKIDNQGVFIDCPPLNTYRYSYKYTSSYGSSYRSKSGQEFYGVILSVFEKDGSLAFQAVTESALESLAVKEMPKDFKAPAVGYRGPYSDVGYRGTSVVR